MNEFVFRFSLAEHSLCHRLICELPNLRKIVLDGYSQCYRIDLKYTFNHSQ